MISSPLLDGLQKHRSQTPHDSYVSSRFLLPPSPFAPPIPRSPSFLVTSPRAQAYHALLRRYTDAIEATKARLSDEAEQRAARLRQAEADRRRVEIELAAHRIQAANSADLAQQGVWRLGGR